jgi:hypothetical protein
MRECVMTYRTVVEQIHTYVILELDCKRYISSCGRFTPEETNRGIHRMGG